MRFDDHYVQQVRSATDIVHLVSGYVNLKKQGANHSGLCPFHNEKTPSFKVNQSLQIFKCFGCGEGGDVFRFIQLMEGLNFPEAIRQLAERQGIPLPASDPGQERRAEEREKLQELMRTAAEFFQQSLERPEGKKARAYLSERQIQESTARAFGLGFAPPGSRLLEELRRRRLEVQDALTCGLLKKNDRGELYDKFRARVMFPIRNLSGQVIAFGGRALAETGPKYLNSPETPLYHKSDHLYGLDLARDEIRRRNFAILVEGYFDCIVPHQAGFPNVVASLGTSLTENQVKILSRYSQKVVLNFDPDSAGVAAAVRSIDLFARAAVQVNVMELPAGADPDSYIREEGAERYAERLKHSLPYMDYLLERFLEQERDPFSPRGKQQVVSQIIPYLAGIPNRIERAEYVSRTATRLRLDERLVLEELRRAGRPTQASETLAPQPQPPLATATPAEVCLLRAVLDPGWSQRVLEQLEPDLLEGLVTEPIFQKLEEIRELHGENRILFLRDQLGDRHLVHLVEGAALEAVEHGLSEQTIQESLRALRRKQLESSSLRLQRAIAQAEKRGDTAELELLLERKASLRRRIELDLN